MPDLTRPPPLRRGDRVGVFAPASPPRQPSDLQRGLTALRERFEVVTLRSFDEPHGYLCGHDETRLDELNTLLARDDLRALFSVRGGYGTMRLLPHLDYEAARAHPKLLVGYSDITALHLALYEKAGLVGLSGPMVAAEWKDMDERTERLFWELAEGGAPAPLVGPADEHLSPVRPGTAQGPLVGGNLSMIQRLVGTPFLPDLENAILYIEDIGEQPYHIDAMLAHLKMAGVLGKLGGLVAGAFTNWEPDHDRPTLSPGEVIADYAEDLDAPVASDLVYGHFPVKNTLPVGAPARLDVTDDTAELSLLEPVVENSNFKTAHPES